MSDITSGLVRMARQAERNNLLDNVIKIIKDQTDMCWIGSIEHDELTAVLTKVEALKIPVTTVT